MPKQREARHTRGIVSITLSMLWLFSADITIWVVIWDSMSSIIASPLISLSITVVGALHSLSSIVASLLQHMSILTDVYYGLSWSFFFLFLEVKGFIFYFMEQVGHPSYKWCSLKRSASVFYLICIKVACYIVCTHLCVCACVFAFFLCVYVCVFAFFLCVSCVVCEGLNTYVCVYIHLCTQVQILSS